MLLLGIVGSLLGFLSEGSTIEPVMDPLSEGPIKIYLQPIMDLVGPFHGLNRPEMGPLVYLILARLNFCTGNEQNIGFVVSKLKRLVLLTTADDAVFIQINYLIIINSFSYVVYSIPYHLLPLIT